MSLITFQIIAAVVIFLMAILAGLLPSQVLSRHEKGLAIGDAWASGVFLGAALLHMLPDAANGFRTLAPNYPYAYLICLSGFIFLTVLERTALKLTPLGKKNRPYVTGILLLIILSIHSFIEGGAIGINTAISSAMTIFIAVLAHKGSASFALAMNLHRTSLKTKHVITMIILFSLMTPLGILISAIIVDQSQGMSEQLLESSFNAFAAGTFLYIGVRHITEKQFAEYTHVDSVTEYIAIIAGIIVMAIVAIYT